jgi:uncharacterized membrane protein HdeD (DUF308 family)
MQEGGIVDMDNTKAWYKSKTVMSSLVTVFAGLIGLVGIVIEPAMQATITNTLLGMTTVVTGAVAIYGRVTANTKVSK